MLSYFFNLWTIPAVHELTLCGVDLGKISHCLRFFVIGIERHQKET